MNNQPLQTFSFSEDIEVAVRKAHDVIEQRQPFIVGIDGRMGVGKSVFARYLSYRLSIPVVHTDDYLLGNGEFEYRNCLAEYVSCRLADSKPLLVDAVFCASLIASMNFDLKFLLAEKTGLAALPKDFLSTNASLRQT
ncbi:hypothetical protein G5B38_10680 [Pseudohalocynthiibacter aestuariivivens]|nr:hypothetical protein [Pseudohalocynthiibacter aestuariivivens]QIE45956.1 hypothetical protein G5B38_10680 [Pseudohalocynthiibacter aestuariivivens]